MKPKSIKKKQIRKAIEFLKSAENQTNPDAPFFAYCEKHQTVHSSLKAEKDCYTNLLSNV